MDIFASINGFISAHTTLSIFYVFLISACIGSFLNVVVYRLPIIEKLSNFRQIKDYLKENEIEFNPEGINKELNKYPENFNLSFPCSHCPKCNSKIKWYYNLPIIGYFLTKMKCSECGLKISPVYPLLETLTGILITTAFYLSKSNPFVCIFTMFVLITWCLALIDFKTLMLPDNLNYALIWGGLLSTLYGINFSNITIQQSILGATVGYLLPASINFIGKKLKGCDVIGGGDFKLLAGIGAFLGVKGAVMSFFIAPVFAILTFIGFTIYNKIRKQINSNIIPFGPSLIFASWTVYFFGNEILRYIGR